MITFKCKMCGGDLTFEQGSTIAECPYCGTTQTLPKLDDDKRANLYDRANHFRRQNEYDKATAIYEQVLAEDRTDAEAYWSLVLCRYGIEYVEDPATHKRVPTVNRVQYASILADEDYKSALQYADTAQRSVYEAEANAIAEIQKGILDISKQEKPFDVFICYKETDNNGRRTPDSVLANDMYHQLTKEGFKVFFSRITLEDKIGTAYEPYIFAALNSAKVMVVLGTKPEYFNAVWVKNEWSRYLALIRAGADKTLVPAYRDMDPYDLPDEFAHLQAQDMGKLGFMQDLIRGIKKILHKDEPKAQPAAQPTVATQASKAAPLLKRAFMFLEDGDFARADDFCEQVLNIDPENGRAYLGKLMVDLKVRKESDLKNQPQPFDGNGNYRKIMRFGDDALKKQVQGDIEFIKSRNEHNRQKSIYTLACDALQMATTVEECNAAKRQFNSIPDFEDAQKKAVECEAKIEAINGQNYSRAVKFKEEHSWDSAITVFEKLGEYRDSQQQVRLCKEGKEEQQRAEEKRWEQVRLAEEAKAKAKAAKQRRITLILVFVAVAVIAAGILYFKVIRPNSIYNSGLKAMNAGNYDEATSSFERLGEYKDAASQALESQYRKGVALLEGGDYDGATAVFESISDYGDAAIRIKQAKADQLFANGSYSEAVSVYNTLDKAYRTHEADYAQMYADAEKLLSDKDYDGAITAFKSISGYKDADTQAKESQYQKGTALLLAGDYDGATTAFKSISGYEDADTQAQESQYQEGTALLKASEYDGATAAFISISGYKDADTQAKESQYWKGTALLAADDYDGATTAFKSISGYEDADTQAQESQYQKGTALLKASDYDGATAVFKSISGYKDADTQVQESQYQKARALNSAGNHDEAYAVYAGLSGYKDVDSIIGSDDNIAAAAWRVQFNVGNTVTFGSYDQDSNASNGMDAIEWIVLANDGDTATLISKYGLDAKPYYTRFWSVTWNTCTLRKWLNEEFLATAFSVEEQAQLATVTVTADKNPKYSTDPGINTQDKVYLLSIDEVNRYFASDADRVCMPTQTAKANGAYTDRDTGACCWWLRSPGDDTQYAALVDDDGSVRNRGLNVDREVGAVRPVVVLRR